MGEEEKDMEFNRSRQVEFYDSFVKILDVWNIVLQLLNNLPDSFKCFSYNLEVDSYCSRYSSDVLSVTF